MDLILFIPRTLKTLMSPIGVTWIFLWGLTFYVFWKKRDKHLGIICLLFSLFYTVTTARPLSYWLLGTLERPYSGRTVEELPQCDAVILLGGGNKYSQYSPFNINLRDGADRITAAFEIVRQHKATNIVISGGYSWYHGQKVSHGDYLTNWVSAWNIFEANRFMLGERSDTRDEALAVKQLAAENGWHKIILVTSGYHMKRAEAVFAKTTGLEVVPFATDFHYIGIPQSSPQFTIIPDINSPKNMVLWMNEILGYQMYKMRGWI